MNVLILVRILIGIGVLDHPAGRLCFQNHPIAVVLLQIIGNLHACALGRAGFGTEFDLGARLITVDGNTANIHFHGAHIERAHSRKVLHDAGTNGIVVALLMLAAARGDERGEEPQGQGDAFHAKVLSNSIEIVFYRGVLQSIPHEKSEANMNDREDGEGIAKRPVDDVPELKDLLGA